MSPAPFEADFEQLFESAPISLWLEDLSALKTLFDGWRAQGVKDVASYLRQSSVRLAECTGAIRVLKVNRRTLQLFAAQDQGQLLARLPEVFRGDMMERMVQEMDALWRGTLAYSNETVNYTLDGRRIDVQIHVQVLQGFESSWSRVMLSLEDVTEQVQARQHLAASEQHARDLFDYSPVSLWVEDFSGVKELMDDARANGIQDFRVFLSVHPEFVTRCIEKIRVIDVNQKTLEMFGACTREELLGQLNSVFRDEMQASFTEQLIDLWNGLTVQTREVVNYSLGGERINIHLQFAVLSANLARWDLVLVSLVDITARKKAEAYLEYLGKHDSLTGLHNRAYYADELNRLSRNGPWPLSILALDLNGLKRVNDAEGHAAGDALLRRVGEVLASAGADQACCMARIGGDEFIALLPGGDEHVAQTLKERIETMLELNNQFYPGQGLSLAIGMTTCTSAAQVEASLQAADHAMYLAKTRHYEEKHLERRRG